jgi:hypothetical protein
VDSPVHCKCSAAALCILRRADVLSSCRGIGLDRQRKQCSYGKHGATRQCRFAQIDRQNLAMERLVVIRIMAKNFVQMTL